MSNFRLVFHPGEAKLPRWNRRDRFDGEVVTVEPDDEAAQPRGGKSAGAELGADDPLKAGNVARQPAAEIEAAHDSCERARIHNGSPPEKEVPSRGVPFRSSRRGRRRAGRAKPAEACPWWLSLP